MLGLEMAGLGARVAYITGLAALACGCATRATPSRPPNFSIGTAHLIYHGVNSFTITPVEFTMVNATSGKLAQNSVSYRVDSSAPDGGYAVALMKRARDPGFLLLANAYLEHQAYEYLLTGGTERYAHAYTSIKLPPHGAGAGQFVPDSVQDEVSLDSLQWRDANKVFIRKVPSALCGDTWVPLTPSSYAAWWQQVNNKFDIEALFNAEGE
jgi:hypothetical protein